MKMDWNSDEAASVLNTRDVLSTERGSRIVVI
jgi:hypothetical protein